MASLATLIAALTVGFGVVIESPKDLQNSYYELTGSSKTILGYATFDSGPDKPPKNCVIHVPPLDHTNVSVWMHEIRHCKEGHFH